MREDDRSIFIGSRFSARAHEVFFEFSIQLVGGGFVLAEGIRGGWPKRAEGRGVLAVDERQGQPCGDGARRVPRKERL